MGNPVECRQHRLVIDIRGCWSRPSVEESAENTDTYPDRYRVVGIVHRLAIETIVAPPSAHQALFVGRKMNVSSHFSALRSRRRLVPIELGTGYTRSFRSCCPYTLYHYDSPLAYHLSVFRFPGFVDSGLFLAAKSTPEFWDLAVLREQFYVYLSSAAVH